MTEMQRRLTCVFVGTISLLSSGESVADQKPDVAPADEHHYFSKTGHQHDATWGYEGDIGPDHWETLSPKYRLAGEGMRQSPIDVQLSRGVQRNLPLLRFAYQKERLSVFNNGHTIQHDEQPGSFLHVGDQVYALEQFHVHLPSEHTINGQRADMEIHFVHKSKTDEVAVVAVMVNAGTHRSVDVPPVQVPEESGERFVPYRGSRNPVDLIPSNREYVTYNGSFTTPPCTEGIRWIVMTSPIQAAKDTIDRLQRTVGGNNRPVQRLFGRHIFITKNSD